VGPLFRHTLDAVLGQANAILADDVGKSGLPPTVTAYAGTAGIVLELAQHPDALTTASELARSAALIAERVDAPPALLYGRMGISLALQAVANATANTKLHCAADAIMPGKEDIVSEQRVDVTHGLAGLGIGYLAPVRHSTITGDRKQIPLPSPRLPAPPPQHQNCETPDIQLPVPFEEEP
jgi:hypothetical protein